MSKIAWIGLALLAWSTPQSKWTEISGPVLKQLTDEGKKIDWPQGSAGVTVDPATGDVYMVVPGQGLWKSADQGKTFTRTDGGVIGGRCETSYALQFDPAGKRLACFMLDGKCAMTPDAGATWAPFTGLGRNWDYAAVDWSGDAVKNIFGARHECGGEVYLSNDAGKTWTMLFKDAEFDRSGGLGIFDEKTLVYSQKGKGIQRSTDAGKTWSKVSDLEPWGRVVRIRKGVGYWLSKDGIQVSKDQGATWTKQGTAVEASIGPMFDPKDEKHFAAAGPKGIFETTDGGETWKPVGPLPEKFSMPKAGWFANVDWDAGRGIFYASQMGKPTFKLETR
jgi:photosystem II stability/assembly factor-like uncharacterized protein